MEKERMKSNHQVVVSNPSQLVVIRIVLQKTMTNTGKISRMKMRCPMMMNLPMINDFQEMNYNFWSFKSWNFYPRVLL